MWVRWWCEFGIVTLDVRACPALNPDYWQQWTQRPHNSDVENGGGSTALTEIKGQGVRARPGPTARRDRTVQWWKDRTTIGQLCFAGASPPRETAFTVLCKTFVALPPGIALRSATSTHALDARGSVRTFCPQAGKAGITPRASSLGRTRQPAPKLVRLLAAGCCCDDCAVQGVGCLQLGVRRGTVQPFLWHIRQWPYTAVPKKKNLSLWRLPTLQPGP